MRVPLAVLAFGCIALGVWPIAAADALTPLLGTAIARDALVPFAAPLPLLASAAVAVTLVLVLRIRRSPRALTWDCGYAAPTARMQYTARSLGEWVSERLTPAMLQPAVAVMHPRSVLPDAASLAVEVREPFAERLYLPSARWWAGRAMRFRWMQQGRLTLYLLYIFVALLAAIAWSLVSPTLEAFR